MSRWELNFSSPVDEILKKPNYTLQDLLDEDETVVDVRNGKDPLINFLLKKESVTKMLSYIVDPAPESESEKVRFRYPAICAEIFIADPDKLLGAISGEKANLTKLFSFFALPQVHLLVANLVVKLINALLASKTAQVVPFLKSDAKWLKDVTSHLEAAAVHELLQKLIPVEGMLQFLLDSKLDELLVASFAKERAVLHSDAVTGIVDLISTLTWDHGLVKRLASEKNVKTLISYALDKNNLGALRYAPRILIALLKLLNTANQPQPDDATKRLFSPSAALKDLPEIVRIVLENVPKFLEILKAAPKPKQLKMQDNTSVEVVGPHRIVLLELTEELLYLNFFAVQNALLDDKEFYPFVLQLIFKFPGNNFVHKFVGHLYSRLLEQSTPETQLTLLKKTDILKKIIDEHNKAKPGSEGSKASVQYLPYLYGVARAAQTSAELFPPVAEYIKAVAGWPEFSTWLTEYRTKQQPAVIPKSSEDAEAFKPEYSEDGTIQDSNDAYLEGKDRDEDDLSLPDDVDLDSTNDADDYDLDQAEILLTKQEIESFS